MERAARVVLGRVVGAHGLRGELRVRLCGDGPGNLQRMTQVALGAAPDDPAAGTYELERAAPGRRGEMRMLLAGVHGREAALALRGLLVLGDADRLEPPVPGEFHARELVGCRVEQRNGRPVGTVRELWHTGAHAILVVEDEAGRDILIPAVEALLLQVDVAQGRVVVEALPGLLDPA